MLINYFKKKKELLEKEKQRLELKKRVQQRDYETVKGLISRKWTEEEINAQTQSYLLGTFISTELNGVSLSEEILKFSIIDRYKAYLTIDMYSELMNIMNKEKTK